MSVVFISGHRNATKEEFDEHYKDQIYEAVLEGHSFVVGDCDGIDKMAQRYLAVLDLDYDLPSKVTVYHIGHRPMNFRSMNFNLKGKYLSDVDRDFAMTLFSDVDLAWVREGSERSGTAQNLFRRTLKADGIVDIQEVMTIENLMEIYLEK